VIRDWSTRGEPRRFVGAAGIARLRVGREGRLWGTPVHKFCVHMRLTRPFIPAGREINWSFSHSE